MLAFSLIVMCLGALALGHMIRRLIALVRASTILSVPLVEYQSVDFREAGQVALCAEGPRFSRRFAGVGFELRTEQRTPVAGQTAWLHARTTRRSTARREMVIYSLPHPGRFFLHVQGLAGARERDGEHRIVFTRPIAGKMTGYILGITLAGCALITGFVFLILSLAGAV